MHNTVNFITLFRTKNKKQAVLYLNHLLAIAIVQIHVIVIMLLHTWRTNKIHVANQINRSGNTLLIDSDEIINPV